MDHPIDERSPSGNPDPQTVVAMRWQEDSLFLLDQRVLPAEETWIQLHNAVQVADAIRQMIVRGAPAIGICAAYGVVLAARDVQGREDWREELLQAIGYLAQSRPTAVNLFWALEKMRTALGEASSAEEALRRLETLAGQIHAEDLEANRHMGELARERICAGRSEPVTVLTHCNTGALATGGHGTALGVVRSLWQAGKLRRVYADETRPWLQGARLTAWELSREGIPVTLNADSAAAQLMRQGVIDWVIVGADRITANGDVANKIGTYGLAVLARHHGVKFMVVAPQSTIDMRLAQGADITIEERSASEVRQLMGVTIAPRDVDVFNPVFDVTPAELIDVIVTEAGIVEKPDVQSMAACFGGLK